MLDALATTELFDQATASWHGDISAGLLPKTIPVPADKPDDRLRAAIKNLHRANFDLWHEEDKARDPSASDAAVAEVKRAIDRVNQRRNDLVEECDHLLLSSLRSVPSPDAPLHSETPGMMLDRLSILTLKLYHTQEEIGRENAPLGHSERNRERMSILRAQRDDLAGCLNALWADVQRGRRRFNLYRQMKMYNDPSLNPAVYKAGKG